MSRVQNAQYLHLGWVIKYATEFGLLTVQTTLKQMQFPPPYPWLTSAATEEPGSSQTLVMRQYRIVSAEWQDRQPFKMILSTLPRKSTFSGRRVPWHNNATRGEFGSHFLSPSISSIRKLAPTILSFQSLISPCRYLLAPRSYISMATAAASAIGRSACLDH